MKRLKITLALMEGYVWLICAVMLVLGYCLLPIATMLDSNNNIDDIF